jgi:hypothetical protein
VCLLVRQLRAAPIAAPLSRTRGHCGQAKPAVPSLPWLAGRPARPADQAPSQTCAGPARHCGCTEQ